MWSENRENDSFDLYSTEDREDPLLRDFRFVFVDHGATVTIDRSEHSGNEILIEPGEIFLDVGNRCTERILDHHHDPDKYDSATRLVTERFDDLVAKPLEDWTGPITLITHRKPDLDGCAAMFYVHERLSASPIDTNGWNKVVTLVSENDQGYLVPPIEHSFPIVFRALVWCWQDLNENDPERFVKEFAFPLIRECLDLESSPSRSETLWDRIRTKPKYRTARMMLERAKADYEEDYRHSQKLQIFLPRQKWAPPPQGHTPDPLAGSTESFLAPERNLNGWSRVDGIIMHNPRSLLFKELCRTDYINSPRRRGFQLMLVHNSTGGGGQHIISTDPMTGLSLKGLGADLESLEKQKENEHNRHRANHEGIHTERRLCSPGRHGYGVNDPWYDGRGHHFTIIDNPASGSVLTEEEVEEALWQYGHPAHFVSTCGLSMSVIFNLTLTTQSSKRTNLNISLQKAGWKRSNTLEEVDYLLSSALEKAYHDTGSNENVHVQHWERELRDGDVTNLQGWENIHSLAPANKARLILFPYGIAFLIAKFSTLDDSTTSSLLEAGKQMETLKQSLINLTRTNSEEPDLFVSKILGGAVSGLTLNLEEEPYFLNNIRLDDTTAEFNPENVGLQKVFAQMANAASLSLVAMPSQSTLEQIKRLPSHCGRHEIWFGDNCATVFELVNANNEKSLNTDAMTGIRGLTDLVTISRFQQRFLIDTNEQALQAIEMSSRRKNRVVNNLNMALADFTTRWRTATISDVSWGQALMKTLATIQQLPELEDAAFKRVSQLSQRIDNESSFVRDRLLFLLTVVFFPVNLAAAMFSGIQMGPFETSEGSIRRWLPWQSNLDADTSGGWLAFLIYLFMFMAAGALTYIVIRIIQRIARSRA